MSRTRAGRKAHETHNNWKRNVGDALSAIANMKFKYSVEQTKAMVIERTAKATGSKEVITFNQADTEIMHWEGKAERNSFSNISDDCLLDMLCDTFLQGAVVHTGKAEYRLWVKPEPQTAAEPKPQTGEILQICLNDHLHDFQTAAARAADSEMGVFADWDKDTFVVVNINTKKEYGVVLQARQNRVFASCTCNDFSNRRRVCKHVAEVLKECFAAHFADLNAALQAEPDREAWAFVNEII